MDDLVLSRDNFVVFIRTISTMFSLSECEPFIFWNQFKVNVFKKKSAWFYFLLFVICEGRGCHICFSQLIYMALHRSIISKTTWYNVLLWMMVVLVRVHGAAARLNRKEWDSVIKLPTEPVDADSDEVGTRWAVLMASSNGYGNYRHQVS